MILLDTNVVSEPLRPEPDARVIEWIDAQPLETLYLSAMTVAELRAGVALLPAGKRRNNLHEFLEKRVLPSFAGRVLPFDLACTSRLCPGAGDGPQGRQRHRSGRCLHCRRATPTDSQLPHAIQAPFRPPAWP